ncbi:MAG: ABC transporter ATP-binding protein [Dehalococcoidia bacterium]
MTGSPSLAVEGLDKTYPGAQPVHALRGVGFAVEGAEFVAIVGPSGSGKTTLLALIGGLLSPSAGRVLVDGRDVSRLSSRELARYRRDSVGYVFQANNLLPFLTGRENLMVMASVAGIPRRTAAERADRLLSELGMTSRAGALATELSGGERQRIAIGRALMNDPALVLVDEPTASLDSVRGRRVVELLVSEIKTRGKLGLMVTHDHDMAALADRVIELHDGEIVSTTGRAPNQA